MVVGACEWDCSFDFGRTGNREGQKRARAVKLKTHSSAIHFTLLGPTSKIPWHPKTQPPVWDQVFRYIRLGVISYPSYKYSLYNY